MNNIKLMRSLSLVFFLFGIFWSIIYCSVLIIDSSSAQPLISMILCCIILAVSFLCFSIVFQLKKKIEK